MSQSRLEWKVGLFVIISLAALGALVIKFAKGVPWFVDSYQIQMKSSNVGGIIPGAAVLMAGVPVGHVSRSVLNPGGKSVTIYLTILAQYQIHGDAAFSIKQAGFLGDRYISIVPTENAEPLLQDGAEVRSLEPFDLQEVALSAAGFLRRMDDTAKKVNEIITRVDHILFAEMTLTNLTATVANFRQATDRALSILNGVEQFVRTNSHPLSSSLSNLVVFSDELNEAARDIRQLISTNRAEVASVIRNIESASLQVDQLVSELQAGKGVVGQLLKSGELEEEILTTMRNLSLLSSNLNRFGLLWKPKSGANFSMPASYTGRSPFE